MFDWNWADIGSAILDPLLQIVQQEGAKEAAYQAAIKAAEKTGEKVLTKGADQGLKLATERVVDAWRQVKWTAAESVYSSSI